MRKNGLTNQKMLKAKTKDKTIQKTRSKSDPRNNLFLTVPLRVTGDIISNVPSGPVGVLVNFEEGSSSITLIPGHRGWLEHRGILNSFKSCVLHGMQCYQENYHNLEVLPNLNIDELISASGRSWLEAMHIAQVNLIYNQISIILTHCAICTI